MTEEQQTPEAKEPEFRSIHQKLLEVMKAIGYVEKKGYNSFHKYSYAREADVMEKLRESCIEQGILIFPTVTDVRESEPDSKENITTTVTVNYRIVNVDDPTDDLEIVCAGQGQDKGDKGVYKALTGAYKYFAMKLFMVSTGDDPEAENPEAKPQPQAPAKPAAPAPKKQAPPPPPPVHKPRYFMFADGVTDEQRKFFEDKCNMVEQQDGITWMTQKDLPDNVINKIKSHEVSEEFANAIPSKAQLDPNYMPED